VSGSNSNALNGAIGGFQFGYNWQMSNVLVGAETDIQLSGQNGNPNFSASWVQANSSVAPLTATDKEKVRGRVGLIANQWLFYTTGGFQLTRRSAQAASPSRYRSPYRKQDPPCPGVVGGVGGLCPLGSWSTGTTKTGWIVGIGAEGVVGGNWSWKAEYLYVDLSIFHSRPV